MAEEIVACPGCAKKFRIPEGAPPGAFPCTACGVSVPYGAPAVAAARGGAKPAARPATKTAAAPARAAAPQRASAARVEAPRGRRAVRDDDEAPPKKSNNGLIWGGIAVGGVVVIGLAYLLTRSDDTPPPAKAPPTTTAAKPVEQPKQTTPPAQKPVEQPKPAASTPDVGTGAVPAVPDASKPTATNPPPKKPDEPARPASTTSYASLGQTFASVAGVSADERTALDKYVAVAMDQASAKDGAEAEGKLLKAGKKAIPSILTAFGKQSTAGKWASDGDQWSADKLQDLLHRIAGADGLNPDFYPRFMSGAPPEDFQKAATMWISWWNNKGQSKDKYKRNE